MTTDHVDIIFRYLNSAYFQIPEYISRITVILDLLINLAGSYSRDLRRILLVFVATHHEVYRFILYKQPEAKMQYLKHMISKIIMFKDLIPPLFDQGFSVYRGYIPYEQDRLNTDCLITLYLISCYNEKIINPIESILESYKKSNALFIHHEKLFIKMFIRYETPWFFIKNLTRLTSSVMSHVL